MPSKGSTVKDVPADKFIAKLADHFKRTQEIVPPEWSDIVKTAPHKQLCPSDEDWFYIRAASIARKVYIRGDVGVGAFQKMYGGRSAKGSGRKHYAKASRGINRNVLLQLEGLSLVKKAKVGRRITKKGQNVLDTIAAEVEFREPIVIADRPPEEVIEADDLDLEDDGEFEQPADEVVLEDDEVEGVSGGWPAEADAE